MIRFGGKGIVLDIEGTTTPIAYVVDVLFPYARRELADYLRTHWDRPEMARSRELIAHDAGSSSFAQWCGGDPSSEKARAFLCAEVLRLMDGDVKATGLKELQGLIWHDGFRAGFLQSQVFPDVAPALVRWAGAGMKVCIFSSGSVAAQRLLFAHTEEGDLSGFIQGYHDTTSGPKRAPESYAAIAAAMGLAPATLLFVSDVTAELDAARLAGLKTGLAVRPGNTPPPPEHTHSPLTDFSQIVLD